MPDSIVEVLLSPWAIVEAFLDWRTWVGCLGILLVVVAGLIALGVWIGSALL